MWNAAFRVPERHDSLAAVFAAWRRPRGRSEPGAARLALSSASVPQDGVVQRTLENSVLADTVTDDAMLAVSAVVTREGGLADLSVSPTIAIGATSRACSTPSLRRGSSPPIRRTPIAVNLVWISRKQR